MNKKDELVTMDIADGSITAKTVTLETPLIRGKSTIDTLTLRKPTAGELRGLRLQAIMESDVNSIIKLLPRVTQPALTETEAAMLDPADLLAMGNEILVFFLPKSVQADLEKL